MLRRSSDQSTLGPLSKWALGTLVLRAGPILTGRNRALTVDDRLVILQVIDSGPPTDGFARSSLTLSMRMHTKSERTIKKALNRLSTAGLISIAPESMFDIDLRPLANALLKNAPGGEALVASVTSRRPHPASELLRRNLLLAEPSVFREFGGIKASLSPLLRLILLALPFGEDQSATASIAQLADWTGQKVQEVRAALGPVTALLGLSVGLHAGAHTFDFRGLFYVLEAESRAEIPRTIRTSLAFLYDRQAAFLRRHRK